ncbi:unnamed protein product [Spirodela intermedia]|uniref:Uncharacterized protein n=1 Tax=Spirodela intermedia TaxID=51605 RepID=A0A7I8ID45_SPIIN|nr:unnamed protein product [Spirodela intermedia]CAA6655541.1 unnamed protein product [Spirodela intermedia]
MKRRKGKEVKEKTDNCTMADEYQVRISTSLVEKMGSSLNRPITLRPV